MTLGAPQQIYIVLTALSLIGAALGHGETEARTIDFYRAIVITLIPLSLLYWGGFFG